MFRYTLKQTTNEMEVVLEGDLDIEGTEVLEDELLPILVKNSSVVINFGSVPFIDSSGVGLLLSLVDTMKENCIDVKIVSVRDEVMEVFDLLQIPDIVGESVFS